MIGLVLIFGAIGCRRMHQPAGPLVSVSGITMGAVPFQVTLVSTREHETDPQYWRSGILEQLQRIDRLMSTYRDDSEVSRFNAARTTDWFPVSRETAEVVQVALDVSRQTDGAFDVTVGPLVELWHFGRDNDHAPHVPSVKNTASSAEADGVVRKAFEPPDSDEILAAKRHVGWNRLHVRLDPSALRKDDPQIQINLSAVAKGYAVDRVAEWLLENGVRSFLVEVGGEVRAGGGKPDGSPWVVGIEAPRADRREVFRRVPLRDGALATSGDYRKFFEFNGRRFSHTIDPRTGMPVSPRVASVSVRHDECVWADAYATALMVLGPEDGPEFARMYGLTTLFILRSDGGFQTIATGAFA
ncbi:MAG: FAD:protein FMN transferase, partial [Planctomycetota bacterium]